MKKSKIIIIVFLFVLSISLGWYINMLLTAKPQKASDIEAKYSGSAEAFSNLADKNISIWFQEVIEIEGNITSIEKDGVVLNGNIYCQFENPLLLEDLKGNMLINIKGKMIGFDELLMEIKLNQCIIIK